jgi:hypothetical protein
MASPCSLSCPGGGGNCVNTISAASNATSSQFATAAHLSASASFQGSSDIGGSAQGGWGAASAEAHSRQQASGQMSMDSGISASGSASAQSSSLNGQNASSCPNNINQTQISTNISKTLMSTDNSTFITNKSALTSISSAVNQMVVNSITTTTSSSSQNVQISQTMVINVNNVKGDVDISEVSQEVSVNCQNTVQMDLTAIDNVRTDLANEVLNQFANTTNVDSINAANTSIKNEMASNQAATSSLKQATAVKQTQATQVPMAAPPPIIPPVPGANVTTNQQTTNDSSSTTIITAPYTQTNDVSRTIQNSVINAVTQNFTHETVTQLIQSINIAQTMGINISNVGGNVRINNISQKANVVLLSALGQHMDIGTAITASVASSLGTKTDDVATIQKSSSVTLADSSNLRSGTSSDNKTDSTFSYDQALSQSLCQGIFPESLGGSGACSAICLSLLCLPIFVFIGFKLFNTLPPPAPLTEDESTPDASSSPASIDSTTSTDSTASTASTASTSSTPSPSTTSETLPKTGGYYFY